jgi:hypothetical protein
MNASITITAAIFRLAQASADPSPGQLKALIDNSIQMLQSGDINGTVTHLRAAERELGATLKIMKIILQFK